MPKAAAIQPLEWATVHDNFKPFDIRELDRVVVDYAYIELAKAKRTLPGRVGAALVYIVVTLGLMAAVLLGLIAITGAVDDEALLPVVTACALLGCAAVAGLFIPWLLTPYRQWDRTLFGVSVMLVVIAAVAIIAILARSHESTPIWLLAAPCLLLLVMAIGAIVGDFRLRSTAKPPAVDLGTLSPEDLEVLLAVRRSALKRLRSRNIVSYSDFTAFEKAPLDPTA